MRQIKKCVLLLITILFIGIFDTIHAETITTAAPHEASVDMTPFYWTVAIVGGLIAVTLTYVSYKKYRGEIKKKTKNGPNS